MPGHTQTQAEWEQAMARRAMELTRSELYLQMRYMNAALGALALQPAFFHAARQQQQPARQAGRSQTHGERPEKQKETLHSGTSTK